MTVSEESPRWTSSIPIYTAVQKILENAEQQLLDVFSARESALLDQLSNSQRENTVLAQENSHLRGLLEKSKSARASSPLPAKSSPLPELPALPELPESPPVSTPNESSHLRDTSG